LPMIILMVLVLVPSCAVTVVAWPRVNAVAAPLVVD